MKYMLICIISMSIALPLSAMKVNENLNEKAIIKSFSISTLKEVRGHINQVRAGNKKKFEVKHKRSTSLLLRRESKPGDLIQRSIDYSPSLGAVSVWYGTECKVITLGELEKLVDEATKK